jgi:hypothetical protein
VQPSGELVDCLVRRGGENVDATARPPASLRRNRRERRTSDPVVDAMPARPGAQATLAAAAHQPPDQSLPLPPGWERQESQQYPGNFFYKHLVTGKAEWNFPSADVQVQRPHMCLRPVGWQSLCFKSNVLSNARCLARRRRRNP